MASSRQCTSLSMVNSGMKLGDSLQFTGINGNGHFKMCFTWLTRPHHMNNTPMSHARCPKDLIMESASAVPSCSRQHTPLSVMNSWMKLSGSLQFTGTNGNGHFKKCGSRDWHAHISWITRPCHMHSDLKISSWSLLVLFLLLADNVLLCQWWTQGWNWVVAFSLPVLTEMAILKGVVHVTDTPISRG